MAGASAVLTERFSKLFRKTKHSVETRGVNREDLSAQLKGGAIDRKPVQLAPVLKPQGGRSSLSDGFILLSGAMTLDLEASERFRMLRAQIERSSLSGGKRHDVIAVTSAVPSEGKSVAAVNLARAFGADPQGKTLLIDCDLRKPNVHRFFAHATSPGLSDVLVAGKSIASVIRNVEPGLDVMTAGSPVVDSTRTIELPGLPLMLQELKRHYRYIILDCPPVLLCSEMMTISHAASSTLLVVRAWRTEKQLVREAVDVIGKKSVLGIVLNECTDTLTQYGYYGYYGYHGAEKEALLRAKLQRGDSPGGFSSGFSSGMVGKLLKRSQG